MKWIVISVLALVSGWMYAATIDGDGNLVLSKEEVMRAESLWNETNRQLNYFRSKSIELQKELDTIKLSKCS